MEAHPVRDEVANPREDLSCNDDSVNNDTQSILGENDVSGGLGNTSCTRKCKTDIGVH